MFTVTGARPAGNLTRDRLWDGLLRKAEAPMPFVPAISACTVLERDADGLVREVVLRGDVVRERVTFEPRERVTFERLDGPAWGRIENRIEPCPDGGLQLRFTFELSVDGLPAGSPEEDAYARRMAASYLAAVDATLAETRRLAALEPSA